MKALFTVPPLLRTTFARSTAILTSAAAIQNIMVLAVSPILSRLFSPEEFGAVGLLYAIAAVPATLSTGHYFLAVMQTRKQVETINIIALSWVCILATTALGCGVVAIGHFHPELIGDFGRQLGPLLLLAPLVMLTEGALSTGRIWDLRRADYRSLFRNRLIETGTMIIAQLAAGLVGAGALGLAGGRLLGVAAAAVDAGRVFLGDIGRWGRHAMSFRKMRAMAARYWRFPAFQTPAELMGCLIRQMPPILLAAYFSMEATGLYWLANRVLERPILLFGVDMSRVFMQQIAERRDRGGNVLSLFVKVTLFMAGLSLPAFLLVILFGPQLFAFVFGAEWYHAGEYARWMALFSFAYLFALPTRAMTAVFSLQRAYAIAEVIRTVLGAISIVLAAGMTGDDVTAMAAFSVVQLVVLTVFVVAVFLIVRRLQAANPPPLGTLRVLS